MKRRSSSASVRRATTRVSAEGNSRVCKKFASNGSISSDAKMVVKMLANSSTSTDNMFSKLPAVDDLLNFLCFRETDILPLRLNYLDCKQSDISLHSMWDANNNSMAELEDQGFADTNKSSSEKRCKHRDLDSEDDKPPKIYHYVCRLLEGPNGRNALSDNPSSERMPIKLLISRKAVEPNTLSREESKCAVFAVADLKEEKVLSTKTNKKSRREKRRKIEKLASACPKIQPLVNKRIQKEIHDTPPFLILKRVDQCLENDHVNPENEAKSQYLCTENAADLSTINRESVESSAPTIMKETQIVSMDSETDDNRIELFPISDHQKQDKKKPSSEPKESAKVSPQIVIRRSSEKEDCIEEVLPVIWKNVISIRIGVVGDPAPTKENYLPKTDVPEKSEPVIVISDDDDFVWISSDEESKAPPKKEKKKVRAIFISSDEES